MVNAGLNGLSAVLLTVGFLFIRRGKRAAHRFCMVSAFIVSVVFLISYLVHHYLAGIIHFQGQGWTRNFYFFILTTHTFLAALVPILAILTLRRALRGDFGRHKKIARITLPIWFYVSVTGVLVYFMLYQGFLQ
jgi:uncharacterized membrane protein YozB (DUF420 family)